MQMDANVKIATVKDRSQAYTYNTPTRIERGVFV